MDSHSTPTAIRSANISSLSWGKSAQPCSVGRNQDPDGVELSGEDDQRGAASKRLRPNESEVVFSKAFWK